MADVSTFEAARRALADPAAPAADLYEIVQRYPGLWTQVAAHPAAYPDLLAWLATEGEATTREIAIARLHPPALDPLSPPATVRVFAPPPTAPVPAVSPDPPVPVAEAVRPLQPTPPDVPEPVSAGAVAGGSTEPVPDIPPPPLSDSTPITPLTAPVGLSVPPDFPPVPPPSPADQPPVPPPVARPPVLPAVLTPSGAGIEPDPALFRRDLPDTLIAPQAPAAWTPVRATPAPAAAAPPPAAWTPAPPPPGTPWSPPPPPDDSRMSGAMKALIIGLSVLLVAGIAAVVYFLAIAGGPSHPGSPTPSGSALPTGSTVHPGPTPPQSPPSTLTRAEQDAWAQLQLTAQATGGAPYVADNLVDRWTTLLSAKKSGLVWGGKTWTYLDILAQYFTLWEEYPQAVVVPGDAYTSAGLGAEWYLIVSGLTFPDADAALAWCSAEGYGRDDCAAFRITNTPGTNTKQLPR